MTAQEASATPDPAARQRLVKTIVYYLGFVILGLVVASLGPTLTGLAENTHATLRQISILFTARSLGYLFGTFLAGRVYDRLPGHRVMAVGMLGLGITMFFTPLIPILAVLVAVLLVMGLSEGTYDVGGNTLLVWVHGERVGPFMNGLHFFFGIGAFVAPVIVAQSILATGTITIAYWVLAGLAILPGLVLFVIPSPVSPHTRGDSGSAPTQVGLVALLMLFFFLYVGAEVSFGGWIFTYAQAQGLALEAEAAYLTSAFWGSYMIGRLLSIPLARRFRPRSVLLVDLLGCILSATVLLIWSRSVVAVWAGAVGVGFFMASIFPTALVLAGRRMKITGFTTSLFFVGSSLGAMLVPLFIGQLFERLGPLVTMRTIFTALVLDLAVFIVLTLRFPAARHE
jgi:MFS transporter, FHS family, Na+ dependent glucose transporter 1